MMVVEIVLKVIGHEATGYEEPKLAPQIRAVL